MTALSFTCGLGLGRAAPDGDVQLAVGRSEVGKSQTSSSWRICVIFATLGQPLFVQTHLSVTTAEDGVGAHC